MAKLDLTYDIVNYTPATASTVDANFNAIEQFVNQELIERDGTVAMRAQLKLLGDPVSALDAAPKQYVDQVLPIGIIMMHGGATAPPGGRWLVCNGAELQTASYPDLYNVIGHNFSPSGTPGSRFHLPNLRDRVGVGIGTNTTMGETGGYRNGSVIKHDHGMKDHVHPIDHDHPNSTTGSGGGAHQHAIFRRRNVQGGANATDNEVAGADPGSGGSTNALTGESTGAHTHTVNVAPQNNKNSGKPNDNTTQEVGVDPDNRNMPPYLGVLYVIRVK